MNNRINVKYIKTCYDYPEYYWMIDYKPIVDYLDEYIADGLCPRLSQFGTMRGLLPAWTGDLEQQGENDFIWELIDTPEEKINLPILVCEDDCDLSCIVILVQLRKTEQYIYWDKIGVLKWDNWDKEKEQTSGILYLESYTDEDWVRYGDNIATEQYNSREYWEWVSKNWYEENIRRLRNYMKPYMQADRNIDWIKTVNWQFDKKEYMDMVEDYRNIYKSEFKLSLRAYRDLDAEHIISWVKDEISFRKWCADRYDKYPITADDINKQYEELRNNNNFYPMAACDEHGIVGHFIMRFTDEDRKILRLGFIIIDDTKRGLGYGKEMLSLALRYAFDYYKAAKVTLGVFENNEPAYRCYKSVGFREVLVKKPEVYSVFGEEWKCLEMECVNSN